MVEFNFYWVANELKKIYPERITESFYRKWSYNRCIKISTPIDDMFIHYELNINHFSLHFEESYSTGGYSSYQSLVNHLVYLTETDKCYDWNEIPNGGYCCDYVDTIDSVESLLLVIKKFISYFDSKINEYLNSQTPDLQNIEIIEGPSNNAKSEEVILETSSLEKIYQLKLRIPEYQRIYCWEEENVRCLLEDIGSHMEQAKCFRLGSIILHYHDGQYDIIDGQQRLVTLSLLLYVLNVKTNLLDEKFSSSEAKQYIAYNKYLINNYVQKYVVQRDLLVRFLREKIQMEVLILHNSSLDLAYTFFSNENSRGVSLSDYDLLKAHHLRFIPALYELQSQKCAEAWNAMIEHGRIYANEYDALPDYARTLDTYIFNLRHWMRKQSIDTYPLDRHIKREYEAAATMPELAPFGETFYFNEHIQGGSHFFTFVEYHLTIYRQFIQTPEYIALSESFSDFGSCQWYKDTIAAILFAYFEKFRQNYLTDVLVLIMRVMLEHRYNVSRVYQSTISAYASETGLILMLDQATSPTFFIAEIYQLCRNYPTRMLQDLRPVQKRMRQYVRNINDHMKSKIYVDSIKKIIL